MPESEKRELIARSLNCINLIPHDKLVELTRTWMKVISEIEPVQLTEILQCYLLTLDSVNLFSKIDPKLILDVFFSLSDVERNKLIICLKEALFLNPDRQQILNKIPTNLAKIIFN